MNFHLIQPRLNYKLSLQALCAAWHGWISGRVPEFNILKNYFNQQDIYFFNHGRTGLRFILQLFPEGTRVGVQPYTCPTVLEAIKIAGCRVVFVDINDQLILDEHTVRKKIDQMDVLIVTHTFGYPADVKLLRTMFRDLIMIEDCSHAFLSKSNLEHVGFAGDFSFFSHGYGKFPSAVQGGFVFVNNKDYAVRFNTAYQELPEAPSLLKSILSAVLMHILHLRWVYSLVTYPVKQRRGGTYKPEEVSYHQPVTGGLRTCISLFYQIIQSHEQILKQQKTNGKALTLALKNNSSFRIYQPNSGNNYFMVPAAVNNPEHFVDYALSKGIETARHFLLSREAIHHFGYKKGECPVYENVIQHIVVLPCHYNYPQNQLARLISIIQDYDASSLS